MIRRMVNAEGMDRATVGNLFFKSSTEMNEILSSSSSSSSGNGKRVSMSTTIQEMGQEVSIIVTKLEAMEKMLRKVSKKLGITTKSNSTPVKKKKKSKKKKTSYADDEYDER